MRLMKAACVAGLCFGLLSVPLGCETTSSQRNVQAKPQSAEHAQAVMAMLTSLDGEWELANPTPEMPEGRTTFTVSSAGSVVREIMVPGTPHEMTNLYHMDGDDVVCTHYCAAGNQPRMVSTGVTQVDGMPALDFQFDSISNYVEGQDHYMGSMRLVWENEDLVRQEWTSYNSDGEVAGELTFLMKRVQ